MGGSWRIGRIAGIDLYVHVTFLILVAWFAIGQYFASGWEGSALSVLMLTLLFGIVVLHELGHALAARAFGIGTHDITLLPIGGVARLERIPDRPIQGFVIAVAGPAVNLVLAIPLYVGLGLNGALSLASEPLTLPTAVMATLLYANVMMLAFNLLPAFPMDGGRVLRALLALRLDYILATRIAVGIGQAMAIVFGLVALTGNPMLLLVALFVFVGAGQELQMVKLRTAAHRLPVRAVMARARGALSPGMSLDAAVRFALAGGPRNLPVIDGHRPAGIITRDDLLAALSELGGYAPVREVMRTDVITAHPDESLLAAIDRAASAGSPALLVVKDGRFVGQVDLERVSELLEVYDPAEIASLPSPRLPTPSSGSGRQPTGESGRYPTGESGRRPAPQW